MSDLAHTDPCVLFALRREATPFLRQFRPNQRFPGAPCWARFCGPAWLTLLVLETGLGRVRMTTALDWLLEPPALGGVPYRPKVVLSAGFSGALQENYRVGDLVLATEIVEPGGECWPATWPGELPGGEWRPPLHRGRLLTTSAVVTTPAEKKTLGERHQALAVDMESAVVARYCKQRGIPFGCVRAVSDDLHTPLSPRLAGLVAGGRVSLGRLLVALARSPGLAPELWRLARATRLAAEQLARALGELLTLTLPWGAEL